MTVNMQPYPMKRQCDLLAEYCSESLLTSMLQLIEMTVWPGALPCDAQHPNAVPHTVILVTSQMSHGSRLSITTNST